MRTEFEPLDNADLAIIQADEGATDLEKRLARDLDYLLQMQNARLYYEQRFRTGTPP